MGPEALLVTLPRATCLVSPGLPGESQDTLLLTLVDVLRGDLLPATANIKLPKSASLPGLPDWDDISVRDALTGCTVPETIGFLNNVDFF